MKTQEKIAFKILKKTHLAVDRARALESYLKTDQSCLALDCSCPGKANQIVKVAWTLDQTDTLI